ncbi:MAG: T9SS type A sorting domain-containing protein [Candidatus Hydrothermia bacterium]
MKKLLVLVMISAGVLAAAPIVDGTVNPSTEGYILVAENPQNTDKIGADLLAFYYAVANDSLYLAITTQNTASWDVAYGFVLDCAEGGYAGDPGADVRDSWGRKLYFPDWNPDYQIYFWYSGSITSANYNKYENGSWSYNFAGMNYVATYGNGLQALEVAVPLQSLGNPSLVKSIAYIVGGDNSSAVDILPYDSNVSLTGGEEWTDWDTITVYFTLNISERSRAINMQPILNGVRISGNGEYVLEVYSVDGKLVTKRRIKVTGTEDVIFRLKAGLYLVKESTGKAQKFIVAK